MRATAAPPMSASGRTVCLMHTTGVDLTDQHLRAWARGVYPQEAAVELLIRTGWTRRTCLRADHVLLHEDGAAWVDWDRLGQILNGHRTSAILAASGGELRVLRLAHHIAAGDLGALLPGLDRAAADWVLAALAHANGSHEHSGPLAADPSGRLLDQDGQRFSFSTLPSLHPWPDTQPH